MRRIYWKDIRRAITASKGRFASIFLLMMLGSFAFVGLKSTAPDMRDTVSDIFEQAKTMDLTVEADYGLSAADQKELKAIKGATVDFGYQSDLTIANTTKALRVSSYDASQDQVSQYAIISGRLPKTTTEIALDVTQKAHHKLGDKVIFKEQEDGILKGKAFKVTGFVKSSEIVSKTSRGMTTSGDGQLAGYAVVLPEAFKSATYQIARLRFDDLRDYGAFTKAYNDGLNRQKDELEKLLADNGQARLKAIKEESQKTLDQSSKDIQSAQATLEQNSKAAQALKGQEKVAAEQKLKQAQASIAQKETELEQAQEQLNHLAVPTYHVYTRASLPGGEGYVSFKSSADSIDMVGNVFPVVLYLVAALVTFTTMTRYVDEERTNSAVLKALGYSNRDIILKFTIYGFLAAFLGTVVGVLAGSYVLPALLSNFIMSNTTLGQVELEPRFIFIAIAFLLVLLSGVLPVYWIASRELVEKPAQLLQPKPPKEGSKILLERFSWLWQRMSFTQKVTARNIFRYKLRMYMTIFGVAGSVALLFAGLGIQSAIGRMLPEQFGRITSFDMILVSQPSASDKEKQQLKDFLDSDQVSRYQPIYLSSTNQKIDGLDDQKVTIMVSDQANFGPFVKMTDVTTDQDLDLPKDGVYLTQKLASHYGAKPGDYLTLTDGTGKKHKVKLVAIVENYAGHYIFTSKTYYQKVMGRKISNNAYLVDTDGNREHLANQFLDLGSVSTVIQNSATINTLSSVVKSLSSVMLILVFVSVLLALVILYNLNNINIAERIRELSTIKVLGFYDKEVSLYIYRETIVLSLIGIALGLISGHALHTFIIHKIGNDSMTFSNEVDHYVYWVPIVVVVLILACLGLLIHRQLKRVDMLEALKSVE